MAVLDLAEPGRQIGEKLFVLLTEQQRKDLEFFFENETGSLNSADSLYLSIFRNKYSIPKKVDQPLTEGWKGALYFCLEQRFVTVHE